MARLLTILLFVGLVAVMLLPGGAAATGATQSEFTATDVILGVVPPQTTHNAGEALHARDGLILKKVSATDPRFSGDVVVAFSYNYRLDTYSGPQWGTWRVENEGGYWEGNWTGGREPSGVLYGRGVGTGGGGYSGLHVQYEILSPGWPASTTWTGRILDPGTP